MVFPPTASLRASSTTNAPLGLPRNAFALHMPARAARRGPLGWRVCCAVMEKAKRTSMLGQIVRPSQPRRHPRAGPNAKPSTASIIHHPRCKLLIR
jgi:hypothetical protein